MGSGESASAVAASSASAVASAIVPSAGLVKGTLQSGDKAEVGAGISLCIVSRKEGASNGSWTADDSRARCLFALDGYSLYKFKDVAGDIRECMLTRFGDYILATPRVPHVWER